MVMQSPESLTKGIHYLPWAVTWGSALHHLSLYIAVPKEGIVLT